MKNSVPSTATARRTAAAGSGEPPQDMTRTLLVSTTPASGLFTHSSAMVDAMFVTLTRSRSMTRSVSAAEKVGWMTCRPPTAVTA